MVDSPARAVVRRPARPPARRARRHPELRVQRGRRPLHRHRPLARRSAGAAAARGRCAAGADQLLARSVDGMTIGTPMAALLDGREPLLCVGHERRAAAAGARLPRAHAHPRALRLRRRLQVAPRAGGHDLRRRRRLLGGARLGAAGHGEDRLPDRPARPVRPARRRHRAGRRRGLGPGPRASGPSRCRSTTVRGSRRRCCPCRRSTPGCSGATTGRPPPAPTRCRCGRRTARARSSRRSASTPFPDGATGWHTITVSVG